MMVNNSQKIRVLVADDNREYVAVLCEYLRKDNRIEIVGSAYDGVEALNMLRMTEPDVLVLDLVMPNLDGLGVLERMNTMNIDNRPKILIVSAVLNDNIAAKTISLGAEYFMLKPVDFDVLLNRITMFVNETDEQEVLDMLKIIQEFDPAGVGARDLRECLLLQIRHCKKTPEVENAIRILRDHFNEFTSKHFQKIMTRMNLSEAELKAAIAKILKLNPSPGGQIDDSYTDQAQQIVPDFQLEYKDGELLLSMPRFSVPELRVNRKYADILMEASNSSEREKKEAAAFVKKKIDSAKWFVEAIKQRHNTLSSTMQAIVDYQHDYFVDGDESHLKPMVLKDIAEKTGFDISTISRVVNSKYIETHFGIYSLKYFFSEGLENQDGEEVSTRELKKALQECVDNEDKHKPYTDDELVDKMTEKGYKVARRTIAKYRDQLGIPKARLRKEL